MIETTCFLPPVLHAIHFDTESSAPEAGDAPGAAALAAGTGGRAKRTRVKAIMEVRVLS